MLRGDLLTGNLLVDYKLLFLSLSNDNHSAFKVTLMQIAFVAGSFGDPHLPKKSFPKKGIMETPKTFQKNNLQLAPTVCWKENSESPWVCDLTWFVTIIGIRESSASDLYVKWKM